MEVRKFLLQSSEDKHPLATMNCTKKTVPCHLGDEHENLQGNIFFNTGSIIYDIIQIFRIWLIKLNLGLISKNRRFSYSVRFNVYVSSWLHSVGWLLHQYQRQKVAVTTTYAVKTNATAFKIVKIVYCMSENKYLPSVYQPLNF